MKTIKLAELIRTKVNSLDPSKFPDTQFNLCSISAFDQGKPEVLLGKEIGSSKKILIKGDVVISRIVPHIKRVWEIPIENENIILGSGEWIVFNSTKIVDGYLRHFLQTELFHQQFMCTVKGVGGSLLRADPKLTAKIEIPLPLLPVQQKIAAILDAADAYRQKTKALIEKYDQLAQSLFLDMFGDPVKNEKKLKIVKLKDVTTKITDGVHAKPNYTESGVPFISVKDVTTGILKFNDCKFISKEDHDKFTKRCAPEYLDILYTKVGATYGRPAIIDTSKEFSIYVSVALIKPDHSKINPYFLKDALANPAVKKQADKSIKGIGVPDLHLNMIQEFLIPLPDFSQQKLFADRIEVIEAQKQQAQASLQKAEELFNSLLQKAFNGELVG